MSEQSTAIKLAVIGKQFNILKASEVLKMNKFPRYQAISENAFGVDECYLLLFVSHRWESLVHPDPRGQQLAGIQQLIRLICDVCEALMAESDAERLQWLPTLRGGGVLQSMLLLTRLLSAAEDVRLEQKNYVPLEIERGQAHTKLPKHIGIWYDYGCMPQKPRDEDESIAFAEGLVQLPLLLQSTAISLVALREEGDDYESRGWCLAEARLAAGNHVFPPLSLRLDLLDSELDYVVTTRTMSPQSSGELDVRFEQTLAIWETPGLSKQVVEACWHQIFQLSSLTYQLLMLRENRLLLEVCNDKNPALQWMGILFFDLARRSGQVFDLSVLLLNFLRSQGLRCSEDNDLVYVGLLTLHSCCAENGRLGSFLQACFERHARGMRLLVRMKIEPVTEAQGDTEADTKPMLNSEAIEWTFLE